MTKELYEVLLRMKESLMHKSSITLSARELHYIIKYINELELEICGEDEEK